MSKLPAFQFYPGDWRKDMGVQSLSFHDRGVWWEMLCLMHESERRGVLVLNSHPMNDASLSRLLGLDNQILTTTITNLLASGVASREEDTGAIYSRRMVRDEKLRNIRVIAGSKGGNPILLNQKTTTQDKQIPTPSSSSSTSTTKPKNTPSAFLLPDWISQDTWAAFEEMRRKERHPLTDRARQNIVNSLARFKELGDDPDIVLNRSITNGWRGVWPLERDGKPPQIGIDTPERRERQDTFNKQQEEEGYAMWLSMPEEYRSKHPWKKVSA